MVGSRSRTDGIPTLLRKLGLARVVTVMRRWLAGLMLLLAACGGGGAASVIVGDGSPDSTLATANQVVRQGDDFFAPDWSFGLADGTTFETAAISTPVYVMFWAEW